MSIFKNTSENQVKLYRFIVNLLKKYNNPVRRKKLLIDCLVFHGYTTLPERIPEFQENDSSDSSDSSDNEFQPGIDDQQFQESYSDRSRTSTNIFNRTFIQTDDQRMIALQQRIKENSETDYDKVKEIVSVALNQLSVDINYNSILQFAMNMYLTIKKEIEELSGDVKRGTMVYILYYSLLEHKINIPPEDLLVYFNKDWNIGILPKAAKVFLIFGEKNTFKPENFLCNVVLDIKTREKVTETINILKENRIFSEPATISQVAAVIYYITNLYGPGKTYHELKESCRVSPDTIRKIVKTIKQFFNQSS